MIKWNIFAMIKEKKNYCNINNNDDDVSFAGGGISLTLLICKDYHLPDIRSAILDSYISHRLYWFLYKSNRDLDLALCRACTLECSLPCEQVVDCEQTVYDPRKKRNRFTWIEIWFLSSSYFKTYSVSCDSYLTFFN